MSTEDKPTIEDQYPKRISLAIDLVLNAIDELQQSLAEYRSHIEIAAGVGDLAANEGDWYRDVHASFEVLRTAQLHLVAALEK